MSSGLVTFDRPEKPFARCLRSDYTRAGSALDAAWDESNCPDAYAVLTYSQSTNPESPHYADSTRLYSESAWIDMPFCEADRDAQEIDRVTIEE